MISRVGVRQCFLGSGGRGHGGQAATKSWVSAGALRGSVPWFSHLHRELRASERPWPFLLCGASAYAVLRASLGLDPSSAIYWWEP